MESVQDVPDPPEPPSEPEWKPKLGDTFKSYEEFKGKFDQYAHSSFTEWVTGKSRLIKTENILLAAKQKPLYNENLKYVYGKYTCKCGGTARIGTGMGIRTNQGTWKIGCPALVEFESDKVNNQLKIVKVCLVHNHDVTPEIKMTFPKSRKLNPEVQERVEGLLKAKVKPSLLRNLVGKDVTLTTRDIANIKAKMRRDELGGLTEEEKLLETVQELLDEDPGSSVCIGKGDDDSLEILFFQTSEMKDTLKNYPSVLIMDTTYKINKNQMPVVVIMVMDGHGAGRVVTYAFVANELKSTIGRVLQFLKQSIGEDVINKVKVAVMDKDYSEIGAVKDELPHVSIQLCDFHVSRTFSRKCKKEDPTVLETLTLMRHCSTQESFDNLKEVLKTKASSQIYDYLEKNWLNIPESWSWRDRDDSLGNTTSNRVENHNAKIKLSLCYENTLYEAFSGLLELYRTKQIDIFFRDMTESIKRQYIIGNKDPVIDKILTDFKMYPATYMRSQFKLSKHVDDLMLQNYESREDTCKCISFRSYRLPCRHMMHIRHRENLPVYTREEIDPMWLQESTCSLLAASANRGQSGSGTLTVERMPPRVVPSQIQKPQQRHTIALDLAKKIASLLSECGTMQFAQRYQVLQDLLNAWKAGKDVVIASVDVGQGEESSGIVKDKSHHITEPNGIERENVDDDLNKIELDNDCDDGEEKGGKTERVDNACYKVIVLDDDPDEPCISATDVADKAQSNGVLPEPGLSRTIREPSQKNTVLIQGTEAIQEEIRHCKSVTDVADKARNNSVLREPEPSPTIREPSQKDTVRLQGAEAIQEEIRYCLCGLRCLRCISTKDNRNKGRVFYVCAQRGLQKCSYYGWAKKNANAAPRRSVASAPLASHNIQVVAQIHTQHGKGPNEGKENEQILWEDDDSGDERLRELVEVLEKDNAGGVQNSSKTTSTKQVTLKLPVSVKHKGRPKGKTTFDWPSTGKRNIVKGAAKDPLEERIERSKKILDSDVECLGEGAWKVFSQTHPEQSYDVHCHDGVYLCSCPDAFNPCKHILKVQSRSLWNIADAAIEDEDDPDSHSVKCCTCSAEISGSHKCVACKLSVHGFDPCSTAAPNAEEGYGQERICKECGKSNGTARIKEISKRKGMGEEELNAIVQAPDPDVSPPRSGKTSQRGRTLKKKILFSPQ